MLDLLLTEVRSRASIAEPPGILRINRDPKDNVVIETAIVGGASVIVSRDEDITRDLRLINYLRALGIEVLTVSQFLARLSQPTE